MQAAAPPSPPMTTTTQVQWLDQNNLCQSRSSTPAPFGIFPSVTRPFFHSFSHRWSVRSSELCPLLRYDVTTIILASSLALARCVTFTMLHKLPSTMSQKFPPLVRVVQLSMGAAFPSWLSPRLLRSFSHSLSISLDFRRKRENVLHLAFLVGKFYLETLFCLILSDAFRRCSAQLSSGRRGKTFCHIQSPASLRRGLFFVFRIWWKLCGSR